MRVAGDGLFRGQHPGVDGLPGGSLSSGLVVVVGERGLKEGKLEYQGRCDQASTPVAMDELLAFVKARLCAR